ncbi:MAG: nitroreductase family protein [Phycisphaerales bacterium]|nr:MAG: nitroreductase family protein [Phycisphaerales bacterium]
MLERLTLAIRRTVLHLVAKSGFLCSVYYAFCSSAFRREHRGAVCGRLKYMRQARNPSGCQYLLRRNLHLLEKGMLMRPRRDVFALDYIQETVACYGRALQLARTSPELVCRSELHWAANVLARYFDVSGSHPIINEVRDRFRAMQADLPEHASMTAPLKHGVAGPTPVEYEELLDLARRRRSVRWFLQNPVPRDVIDRAIAVAALSPSACNLQPFEFRVFDDAELIWEVASLPTGTTGFGPNLPAIVVLIGKLHAWFSEADRHLVYIDASLAAMAFLLALESQGLGSCCLNWPDMESKERSMAKLLGLEPDERVIMLIALGYPDPEGLLTYSYKKSLAELRNFNITG